MNVTVGKAASKTRTPGAYRYDPNPKGDGGSFVETGSEAVEYWHLSVDGVPLAGVWVDEGTARDDARIIQAAIDAGKGKASDAT